MKGLHIGYSFFVVIEESRFVNQFYFNNCVDKTIDSSLPAQKQTDGYTCCHFAVAFATNILDVKSGLTSTSKKCVGIWSHVW